MIGLEPTLDEHLENLVAVFREVRRVLRRDGTLWLNYGDAYASQGTGAQGANGAMASRSVSRHRDHGRPKYPVKPKNLMLLPARVALALQADGWYLRSEIVWHKPNPMPESVTDRPTSAHEKVFLLSREPRYFYDAEAVRVPYADSTRQEIKDGYQGTATKDYDAAGVQDPSELKARIVERAAGRSGANLRNVWQIPTAPFPGAHFATFPPALVEPCIRAGTSARGVCQECGAPWVRAVWRKHLGDQPTESKTIGWHRSCSCHSETRPAVVLDPFGGAGTVALVAQRLGRRAVCIELNRDYARMAQRRVEQDLPITRRPNREGPEAFALEPTP